MAGKFNFTTKLGLDSAGFKAGVNKVRGSLNSLKAGFLSLASSLGAGLGLYQLITNLKDTATQLSVAKNTLKNVSYQTKVFRDGTEEMSIELSTYQDNLSFVKKLSEDYAQDLVAVTDNYAKFTAACKKTDLALEDQRMVFEALTKAAAYYHLSADRTSDMMNAVTQMMSKGKVAAEELRRQLGNTLPGAFNLMAASLGVSNAELDKMMRNGEVIAAEVLPRFAAMLNTITKTAEFDSLQASMNKLKNTWYELVEKSGSEKLFKGIVDGSTKALSWTTDNIRSIKSAMVGLVAYFASVNLFTNLQRQAEQYTKNLEKNLTNSKALMNRYYRAIQEFEKEGSITKSSTGAFSPVDVGKFDEDAINKIQRYNKALLDSAEASYKLGRIEKTTFDLIQKEVNEATVAMGGLRTSIETTSASTSKLKSIWTGIGVTMGKAANAITTFFKANWVYMLISVLVSALNYIKRIKNEAKEISEIASNYTNDIDKQSKTIDEEAAKLKNNLAIVLDVNKAESARLLALKEINKALGLVGDDAFDLTTLDKVKGKYDEITLAVERWIEASKKQALIQGQANVIADATAKKADAERRKKQITDKLIAKNALNNNKWMGIGVATLRKDLENVNEEIKQYDSAVATAEASMKSLGVELGDFYDEVNRKDGGAGGDEKLEGLAKIMADYEKKTKELSHQLKEGAISQKDFNEEYRKLVSETYKAAAATGEVSLEEILKKMESDSTLTALEQWYVDLRDTALQTAQKAILDGIAESVVKDIDEALEQELKEIEKELEKLLEGDEKRRKIDVDYAGVSSELAFERANNKRDNTFDYKKTKADIFGEEADIARDNLDKVDAKIQELLQKEKELMEETGQGLDSIAQQQLENLREDYRVLSREAETLEDAFKFEQIKQDIEDLNKSMTTGVFSGVENLATSLDRVVRGARELRELMENVDTSGWEKLMGVANYIFNIINGVLGVIETINTLTEISNQLASARSILDTKKQTDTAIELESTLAQIAAEQTLTATKQQQATFETAITTNKIAQAEASLGLATALGVETAAWLALAAAQKDAAMAAAAANAAMVAGPAAPAAAIAAAAEVGAGLTATMAAFAKGGIIGGNSTHGDRNIIRANSGEMILTKGQQGTLFSMLNGKGGMGGNVEFKIRGADLVGTINNYSSRRKG